MSQHRASTSPFTSSGQLPEDIFDRIDSAVLVVDHRGRIRYGNVPVTPLLGRPRAEIFDSSLESLLPPDQSFLGKVCSVAMANRSVTTTFGWDAFLNAWIGVRVYPIAAGIEIHVRTIPSGDPGESSQESDHTEVAIPLDAVTIPMQIIDANGLIRFANQAALDLLGYPRVEIVGKPMRQFFLQPDHAQDLLDRIAAERELHEFETDLLHRNGEVRTVQITTGAHDGEESQRYIQCYLRDVTELRANEEREARLAALVDASDDAIIAKRLDGVITSWNPKAERIYGYTAEEAIGQPITLIIPADRKDEFHDIMGRLAQGQRIDHYETVRRAKDGRLLDISVSIAPIRNQAGRIVGASTIARDITERRVLERKQREFLTMVAHDLRSPLTSIKGFAQLMQRREAYSPSAVEAILAQVRHMERLAGDVLDITRLDENRQDLTLSDTDLGAVAQSIQLHAKELRRSGDVHLVVPENRALIGHWDEGRLSQIIDNLVSNALKYAPDGDITISLTPHDDHVTIEVADEGPGINEEHLQYVFDRFYRTPGEHVVGRGVGLGLAITKGLVEAHGGTITVESAPGHGATFTVNLPWNPAALDAYTSKPQE